MRRWTRGALIVLIGSLIVIQFFRPERNLGPSPGSDMLAQLDPPEELVQILQNSCYDCHSNQTEYPWYSQIAPASWVLDKHIREGKEQVNFSTFGTLEQRAKIRLLTEICEVVEEGSMPLKSYLRFHRDAGLSENDKEALCNWTELQALKLMRE